MVVSASHDVAASESGSDGTAMALQLIGHMRRMLGRRGRARIASEKRRGGKVVE